MRFLLSMVFLVLFFVIIAYAGPQQAYAKRGSHASSVVKPMIVTRKQWGARAGIVKLMKPHKIGHITIHHSAVRQNRKRSLEKKLRGLQGFSQRSERLASGKMKKAWGDIPYHYYISVDGRIGEGRETRWAGDTNTNYQPAGHLQILVEGNFQKDRPTPAQIEALSWLVAWAADKWQVPPQNIGAHQDHAQTLCPGKNLLKHLEEKGWRVK